MRSRSGFSNPAACERHLNLCGNSPALLIRTSFLARARAAPRPAVSIRRRRRQLWGLFGASRSKPLAGGVCEFGENLALERNEAGRVVPPSKRSRTAGQYEKKATCNGAGIWPGACSVDSIVGASSRRRWQCGRKFGWWLCWGRNWRIYGTGSEWSHIGPIAESLEPQHRPSI
jgi:hypothetical protein